jgi:hypothetical protein
MCGGLAQPKRSTLLGAVTRSLRLPPTVHNRQAHADLSTPCSAVGLFFFDRYGTMARIGSLLRNHATTCGQGRPHRPKPPSGTRTARPRAYVPGNRVVYLLRVD